MGSVSLFIFFITLLVLARQVSKLTVATTMTSLDISAEQLYVIFTFCNFTVLFYLVLMKNLCMRRVCFLMSVFNCNSVHPSSGLNLEACESMS